MRGAAAALTSESGSVGTSAATGFAGGFNRVLSGGLIAAGVVAATGVALVAIGGQFDDAYDTIQTGTGATGDALEGLKDVFRDVVADVPTDFASAADAISLLNQRLELTGRPLEVLSEQFLELSRITDTDLTGNIDSVTRAFGDWSVSTEDQSEALDRFFRASQDSGVAVSELAEGVVQFGSPLRQLGFSLDESIALFASFGEAGVNTSTVMSGMRQAVKNFASGLAENETGVRSFGDVLNGVRDGTFDLSDAMTVFGARAGADMFAAIQEGRFDLEDFLGAMRDTQGGINDTAEDTRDFGESFQILKNNIALLLEGPATAFMDWLSDAAVGVADFAAQVRNEGWGSAFGDLLDQWRDAPPAIQLAIDAVALLGAAFVVMGVQAVIAWALALGPVTLWLVLAGAVGAAIYTLANEWDGAGDAAGHVGDVISDRLGAIPGETREAGDAFGTLTAQIKDTGFATHDLGVDANTLSGVWDFVSTTWRDSWSSIQSVVRDGAANIGTFLSGGMEGVKSVWNLAWSSVKTTVSNAWNGIKTTVQNGITNVVSFLQALPGRAVSAIAGLVSGLTNKGREAMQGLSTALRNVWDNVRSWLGGLPERAASALVDMADKFYDAGRRAMERLWAGLKSLAQSILSWLGGFATSVAGSVGDIVADAQAGAAAAGEGFMGGLEGAMRSGWQGIVDWLRTLDPGAAIFGDGIVNIFDLNNAQVGASRIILDIQDAWRSMRQMFADMPDGFQAGTQSGNAFMRALQDQASNIRNYVNSLTAAGDYDGAASALTRMVNAFRNMALTAGLSSDAVDALIDSLFGTLDLSGLADDVELQVSRLESASGRMLDAASSPRYAGEAAQTRVVIDANGVDSALVEWLRRSVRVESGGNVQAYLGA